ncbi:MAG: tRNA (N6-isopentenyl adenosine(37)-C2)-methylthiotransferase MiaB [Myxococcota bacterium]
MTKKVYIRTMGCQMNLYDSDKMLSLLEKEGYELCDDPESAELILFNTCSVREGAANKLRSALGRTAALKKKNKGLIVAVAGCVPATEGEKLKKFHSPPDILITPDTISSIGELLKRARNGGRRRSALEAEQTDSEYLFPPPELKPQKVNPVAYVAVTKGCDNFCSYCIVPYARGREESRDPNEIITEAKTLIDAGAKEIILIGQNVNSYSRPDKGYPTFPKLLREVSKIEGLKRLRFVTSHPRDFDCKLAETFAEIEILCPYLHLPPQSGSDRILAAMNRGYTAGEYLKKIEMVRALRPDIALSGDIIVGFPGETDADFKATLELVKAVEFDMTYAFKYSPRPKTAAAKLEDSVPLEIKQNRLAEIFSLCNDIMLYRAENFYSGKEVNVLVEGVSSNNPSRWQGRTAHNKVVNFENTICAKAGDIAAIKITSVETHSLLGVSVKRVT